MDDKGQTNGLITGLIFGVASLVIAVVVSLVIISTLTGAGLLDGDRTTGTVTNETSAHLNDSGYQLTGFDSGLINYISPVINELLNSTAGVVPTSVYSISSTGLLTNITTNDTYTGTGDFNISYGYTIRGNEELSSNFMSTNLTAGVNEISEKIPTVLLVAAIVLLLGILAILVGVWARMKIGGGSTL